MTTKTLDQENFRNQIEIISGECGAGKTRYYSQTAVRLIEENPDIRISIKVDNHELIRSIKQWIDENQISHWTGFDRSCPLLIEDKDPGIKSIRTLSDKIKCETYCKEQYNERYESCPRRLAFIADKPIHIMPKNYITTKKYHTHNWDWSISDDFSWTPFKDTPKWKINDILKFYSKEVYNLEIELDVLICLPDLEFKRIVSGFIDCQLEQRERILDFLTRRDYKKIKEITDKYYLNYNIGHELYNYKKNVDLFGELPYYGRHPYSYEFDYKTKNPRTSISLVGANLQTELLQLLVNRHIIEGNTNFLKFVYNPIPIPDEIIQRSKIIRLYINQGSRYPVGSMINNPKQIHNMKICTEGYIDEHLYGGVGQKVAVMHSKHIKTERLIDTDKFDVLPVKHFGVFHGYNFYEHAKIFICFGTYLPPPDSVVESYIRNFALNPLSTDSVMSDDYYYYTDDHLLESFRKNIVEENHHQILFRSRPLTNLCTNLVWGVIPDSFAKYFVVDEINVRNYLYGRQVSDTRENWVITRLQAGVDWDLDTWIKQLKMNYPQVRKDRTAINVFKKIVSDNNDIEFTYLRGARNGLQRRT